MNSFLKVLAGMFGGVIHGFTLGIGFLGVVYFFGAELYAHLYVEIIIAMMGVG